jgi:hypothetical protein
MWVVVGIVFSYKGMFCEKTYCCAKDRVGRCPNSLDELWGFKGGGVM